ncbi:peptidoglycan-binding protein [Bacillus sp. JCM 19041]|uniref:peptidoglycan-binding domain-containing protein n=1 Tax=Bacillus sp. JCM 19041 TaxID=1460637 RepID=UPI0006D2B928
MKKMTTVTMTGIFVLAANFSPTAIGFASEKDQQSAQEQSNDFPEFQEPVTIGDEGEVVEMVQTQLTRLGYDTSVDGIFGQVTLTNVKEFQRDSSLTVDGIVDVLTYQTLLYSIEEDYQNNLPNFDHPVMIGDEGEIVEVIQKQLNEVGYTTAVDGVFGQETLNNVTAFQEYASLKQDGIVEALTYQALMYNI